MKKRFISILLVLCMVITLMPAAAWADSSNDFTIVNNVLIRYNGLGGNVTIPEKVTKIGPTAFYNCSELTSVIIPDGVTEIGMGAFNGCNKLNSVIIPDSVKIIGMNAFHDCSELTSIIIPGGVTEIEMGAFNGCSEITSVTILDGVTKIGNMAFYGCSKLNSIDIPNSIIEIGTLAFYDCRGLTSVTIPNSVKTIGDSAFSFSGLTSIKIPGSVKKIASSMFLGCSGLTNVNINNGVIEIGESAFANCNELNNITIPNSVTKIGNRVFDNCGKLTEIYVEQNNSKYITEDGVLFNKDKTQLVRYPEGKNATSYTIPDSVNEIGYYAFYGCKKLTEIKVNSNNLKYITENGVLFNKDKTQLIQYPEGKNGISYTIPDSVTEIMAGAFDGCSRLMSITIPDSVTEIGQYAFKGLSGLTSITIPSKVENIGRGAFLACSGLTSIIIPDGITKISDNAFKDCSGLTKIKIPDSVTNIDKGAFDGCNGLIYVTIPKSVTQIGEGAFKDCEKLTDIYYTGTENEWKKIYIDYKYDYNTTLSYAKKHYNSSGPSEAEFTVTFNLNGYEGNAPAAQTVSANGKATKPANQIRAGYTFGGWFTEPECTNEWNFDTEVSADMILYAKWIKNDPTKTGFTVEFDLNGYEGNAPAAQTVSANGKVTKPVEQVRAGYTFGGWFTEPECTNEWNFDTEVSADMILYAKWIAEVSINTGEIIVNNGTASAAIDSSAVSEAITKANGNDINLTFDLRKNGEAITSTEVTLPAISVKAMADNSNVKAAFKTSGAEVMLSNDVIKKIPIDGDAVLKITDIITSVDQTGKPNNRQVNVAYDISVIKADGTHINISELAEPVTLRLKLSKNTANQSVAVYYVNNAGNWELVGNYTAVDGWVSFTTDHLSQYAVTTVRRISGSDYSDNDSSITTYAVSVPSNVAHGKITVSPRNAAKNSTVTITAVPDKGYKMGTITAKDKNSKDIEVKDVGGGKYTFVMPASKVEISASFVEDRTEPVNPAEPVQPTHPVNPEPATPSNPVTVSYSDVPAAEWYYNAVKYVTDKGLMNGVSSDRFAPDLKLTRGMLVTILYRMEGQPVTGGASFSDISSGQYYSNAVSWAAGNNIVNGYKDGKFGPNDNITREQIAAILYRYANQKGYNAAGRSDLSAYSDSSAISGFALEPMQWANAAGLITGTNNKMLNPNRSATRGQVAKILMQFCENVA